IVEAMRRNGDAGRGRPFGDAGFDAGAVAAQHLGAAVAYGGKRDRGRSKVLANPGAHPAQHVGFVFGSLAHMQDRDELVDERIGAVRRAGAAARAEARSQRVRTIGGVDFIARRSCCSAVAAAATRPRRRSASARTSRARRARSGSRAARAAVSAALVSRSTASKSPTERWTNAQTECTA